MRLSGLCALPASAQEPPLPASRQPESDIACAQARRAAAAQRSPPALWPAPALPVRGARAAAAAARQLRRPAPPPAWRAAAARAAPGLAHSAGETGRPACRRRSCRAGPRGRRPATPTGPVTRAAPITSSIEHAPHPLAAPAPPRCVLCLHAVWCGEPPCVAPNHRAAAPRPRQRQGRRSSLEPSSPGRRQQQRRQPGRQQQQQLQPASSPGSSPPSVLQAPANPRQTTRCWVSLVEGRAGRSRWWARCLPDAGLTG